MKVYFPEVAKPIAYEGPDSKNPLSFKHYNPKEKVLGKTMEDHLRFAVCYWHTFRSGGADMFGSPVMDREWLKGDSVIEVAENTLQAAFEFFTKLGVKFWAFHDDDLIPETGSLAESNKQLDHMVKLAKKMQKDTGIKLIWGTCNLFSHPRFMSGAATNPNPDVFAYAAAKVKKAIENTKYLGGLGYVFWGGREGYETLLNTDMGREMDHLGIFLNMAVDYAKKIGFTGQFYIEPKPKEPTKHQYDFDAASCYAFLQRYGLDKTFKLNLEANHATLAGHTLIHELEYAGANGILGSVDANRGDMLLGWDTDQFPTDLYDTTQIMYTLLKFGGFKTGGFNFDAHVRRQSIDAVDLFHAHVGSMDCFARGLKIAAQMHKDKGFANFVKNRYSGWDKGIGKDIENGKVGFEELEAYALKKGNPKIVSGRQELLENMLNDYIK
ncbi:MAG TPA: xylose isomerase [Candidatus Hydrogenedentes bacterium]|jgi:xylose isomerase|nr:MAG: Xylose isomerase [Candidatus Hydrogenedentes bacterium ADurb.Bin170]HNZ47606.1 xylose isomerase [Candidatus Hydrogenedentota bacterium]HOD94366.1 xylose isomerase [Candidatus Hydrogenedentota bacterium]HOM46962.1 xylose isomerase [Candidatus Hydrogenedentota bacterium]HOR49805.1 xylose isomerase [Candidatus Hydrogenedentota bacterium]